MQASTALMHIQCCHPSQSVDRSYRFNYLSVSNRQSLTGTCSFVQLGQVPFSYKQYRGHI